VKKFLTTFALYDDIYKQDLYNRFIKPRFQKYASLHDLKFIELNKSNFEAKHHHPEISLKENLHFNRWLMFKDLIDKNILKDGDIVYNFDADIFIKNYNAFFIPDKSFTYALDSGNTHCFGFFVLKITPFTRTLIDNIVSRERWLKLREFVFFNEHDNKHETLHIADQQMYQTCAGIKPHSWQSFEELENKGLHSYVTEHTIFSLPELLENVTILPVEWNTTHLIEETGNVEQNIRDKYDIIHTTRDKVNFRHFAGGQPWRFQAWENEFGQ